MAFETWAQFINMEGKAIWVFSCYGLFFMALGIYTTGLFVQFKNKKQQLNEYFNEQGHGSGKADLAVTVKVSTNDNKKENS